MRRGRYKLLITQQPKGWLRRLFGGNGPAYLLFDVTTDGREKADLDGQHPEIVAELRRVWEAFDAELLPYDGSPWEATRPTGLPD